LIVCRHGEALALLQDFDERNEQALHIKGQLVGLHYHIYCCLTSTAAVAAAAAAISTTPHWGGVYVTLELHSTPLKTTRCSTLSLLPPPLPYIEKTCPT